MPWRTVSHLRSSRSDKGQADSTPADEITLGHTGPVTIETVSMAKVIFALGFGIGLAILAIAVTTPQASGVAASDVHAAMSAAHCSLHEVALDEGYGITRKVLQRVCSVAE